MKNQPLISIVVPVLNEEKILENTLKNIRQQSYKNYELIVVDNGSTDNSVNIAKKFADKILFEEKKGSINAMTTGFKNAKGEIIVNCDADSLYPTNYLEKIVEAFNKSEKIVAVYGPLVFIENGKISNFFTLLGYTIADFLSKVFTNTYIVGAANFAIKKEIYDKVGGYNTNSNLASQDFRLAKKLSKHGKVKFIPSLIVLTSNRRFKENGTFRALLHSFKLWFDVAFNINKITYDNYYTHSYYQKKGANKEK
ncbi:glycosyltransferase family 2 protein [Thermosipho atlanticus]|uniref:Glycosyl transferase family 2 n=1 Tax=Thermosipho atlanticus DSM 15807 TaxID=1123380 RepID=A0A1M5RWH9_9BACT|nr:glycosyltransferase family 2 protein [Thermosipho atlanticus]SHH30682.1 Glycosyl transferase family 2 [Thermosipho atlanticus DSM 15807]